MNVIARATQVTYGFPEAWVIPWSHVKYRPYRAILSPEITKAPEYSDVSSRPAILKYRGEPGVIVCPISKIFPPGILLIKIAPKPQNPFTVKIDCNIKVIDALLNYIYFT